MIRPVRALVVALCFVLVGCGGKSSKRAVEPGRTCGDAGANLSVNLRVTGVTEDEALLAQASAIGAEACTRDGWSRQAAACFADARGRKMNACEAHLTAAQNDALGQQLDALLGTDAGGDVAERAAP